MDNMITRAKSVLAYIDRCLEQGQIPMPSFVIEGEMDGEYVAAFIEDLQHSGYITGAVVTRHYDGISIDLSQVYITLDGYEFMES